MKSKMLVRTKLATIKYNTLKLRASHQIPFKLASLINHLTGQEDEKYIKYLLDMSEHMLRVKGYYKKHKQIGEMMDEKIIEGLKELGFQV